MASAIDSTLRMLPMPTQRGQTMWLDSLSEGRRRWRDISSRPKRDRRPIWMRARSIFMASRRRSSTSRWFFGRLHVDEVDDDQAADVTDAQLAGDLVRRFEVGVGRGGFDVAAARGARGVDVDGDQRLGVVDDDAAAGGQLHLVRVRRLDLALDLEAREQRHVVRVQLQPALRVRRHEALHVFLRLLEGSRVVDQDLADVVAEVVAHGAGDGVALLIDQERRGRGLWTAAAICVPLGAAGCPGPTAAPRRSGRRRRCARWRPCRRGSSAGP